MRLSVRLFWGIFLIAFFASGATGSYFYFQARAAMIDSIRQQLQTAAKSAAALIDGDLLQQLVTEEDMETEAYHYIQRILAAIDQSNSEYLFAYTMRLDQGVVRFVVDSPAYDADGDGIISDYELPEPIGAVYPDPPEELMQGFVMPSSDKAPFYDELGPAMSGYAPIYNSSGQSVGLVGIDMSLERIESKLSAIWNAGIVSLVIAVILAVLMGLFFSRRIFDPLARLQQALHKVGQGDYSQRLEEKGSDEIASTARSFNAMVFELMEKNQIKSTLGKLMGRETARHLLSNQMQLGGEIHTATILVCDLRGFSLLSEKLPPKLLVGLINDYFTVMVDVIQHHGGMVDKFVGDMVLAVFGHPVALENEKGAALGAAWEMIEKCDALNEQLNLSDDMRLVNSIGLHSGPVLAGNIGGPERMEYTVMGHTVNVTVRIEKLTRDLNTRLAASADFVSGLDGQEHGLIQDQPRVPYGMNAAIELYVAKPGETG